MIRVYDRANLPDAVLEIIKIVRVRFATWTINFCPEKTGSPAEFSQAGIEVRWPQATNPDGSLEATQVVNEIVISNPTQGDFRWLREPEVHRHVDALFGPFFSPNGRFLLVQSTHPAVRIYDTRTWEQVRTLPGLPSDVVRYFPDKNWKLGVFASSKGDIGLWDSHKRRQIANLASGKELMDAEFSPDHSLVAVAFQSMTDVHPGGLRARIWRTNGTRVSELEPSNEIDHSSRDSLNVPDCWRGGPTASICSPLSTRRCSIPRTILRCGTRRLADMKETSPARATGSSGLWYSCRTGASLRNVIQAAKSTCGMRPRQSTE